MVIQDSIFRSKVNGGIDYGFLDLIDAPHLRFLAAVDSNIGQTKPQSGVDIDNAYEGKNHSLIRFVMRHRKGIELARQDKGFRDLEAVFINFIPEEVVNKPEVKKKAYNLFHMP